MQIIKNNAPKQAVIRVRNNSPPRSFLFANKVSFPPLIALDALSAFPLCNNPTAINNTDIIINTISMSMPPVCITLS